MDRNDQQAIEGLFAKLANVERQAGQRDADADRFIQERVGQQPGAPYFMAQTIVVQEQALDTAQRRIEELEHHAANTPVQRGGFFSTVFGGPTAQSRALPTRPLQASPWGSTNGGIPMQGRGGGFLAGAAQTAMGVAGGVLLGNAVMGMLGGNEANAAEPPKVDDAPAEDAGFDEDLEL